MSNKENLIKATKEIMAYSDERKSCENCKFVGSDPMDDTGFTPACTYSNLCTFRVDRFGSCKFFQPKPTTNDQ
jgi:hypothetical protein